MLFAPGGRSGGSEPVGGVGEHTVPIKFITPPGIAFNMTLLVPFDGSSASEAALDRAVEHGEAFGEDVVAVSFVPTGSEYAERRRWIRPDEEFAAETASADLRRKIEEATDDAEWTFEESLASAPTDGIATRVQQIARDVDTSILFVGTSDGDDRLTTPFGGVASTADYDLYLVRSA